MTPSFWTKCGSQDSHIDDCRNRQVQSPQLTDTRADACTASRNMCNQSSVEQLFGPGGGVCTTVEKVVLHPTETHPQHASIDQHLSAIMARQAAWHQRCSCTGHLVDANVAAILSRQTVWKLCRIVGPGYICGEQQEAGVDSVDSGACNPSQ